MLAPRLLLRRLLGKKCCSCHIGRRAQHAQSGPHKEYFQNPSQYPHGFEPSKLPNDLLHPIQHATGSGRPRSLILRVTRTTSLALACLCLGFLGGTALVTWEYVQPPFERGSKEYEELQENIDEILETAPIVDNLHAGGWLEEPDVSSRASQVVGSRHFVHDTLSGVQGLTMKQFRHPEHAASVLVFFAGFGVEGWPDVLHGGTLMSVMQEAKDRGMYPMIKAEKLTKSHESHTLEDQEYKFVAPVRPGEVFAILVCHSAHGIKAQHEAIMTAPASPAQEIVVGEAAKEDAELYFETVSFLLSADEAPELAVKGERQLDIDTKAARLHAIANTRDSFTAPFLKRRADEPDEEYAKRAETESELFGKRWKLAP